MVCMAAKKKLGELWLEKRYVAFGVYRVFCVKISLIDRKWTDLSHAVASGSNQTFHTGDLLLGYVIWAAGMIEFDKFP